MHSFYCSSPFIPNTSIQLVRGEKIDALAKIERGQRLGRRDEQSDMWAI